VTDIGLVKDCDRCKDLMCKGDWRTCVGALHDICASMELAERERDRQRLHDLTRLRDRNQT
jgi:hypothetical protein